MKIKWEKVAQKNIQKLTVSEALDTLKKINAEGATIFHAQIRALTGGVNSQSINYTVVRLLGVKAQIIKNYN